MNLRWTRKDLWASIIIFGWFGLVANLHSISYVVLIAQRIPVLVKCTTFILFLISIWRSLRSLYEEMLSGRRRLPKWLVLTTALMGIIFAISFADMTDLFHPLLFCVFLFMLDRVYRYYKLLTRRRTAENHKSEDIRLKSFEYCPFCMNRIELQKNCANNFICPECDCEFRHDFKRWLPVTIPVFGVLGLLIYEFTHQDTIPEAVIISLLLFGFIAYLFTGFEPYKITKPGRDEMQRMISEKP